MILVNALMDALNALFPDLTRSLELRGGSPVQAQGGKGGGKEDVQPEGFSAALLHFLGSGPVAPAPGNTGRPGEMAFPPVVEEAMDPVAEDGEGRPDSAAGSGSPGQAAGSESPGPASGTGSPDQGAESRSPGPAAGTPWGGEFSKGEGPETDRRMGQSHHVPDGARPQSFEGGLAGDAAPDLPEGTGLDKAVSHEEHRALHASVGVPDSLSGGTFPAGPRDPSRPAPAAGAPDSASEAMGPAPAWAPDSASEAMGPAPARAPDSVPEGASAGGPADPPRPAPAVWAQDSASEAMGPAPVWAPEGELERLEPEFLARLQRVVDRMEREHGHKVELVEGYRTQERQEALFRQGRSEPGPVVTWTRTSYHSQGRAADLRVDGSWQSPAGYAHLHRIAGEEGLRTLGPKDPGHLELPGPEGPGTSRQGTETRSPLWGESPARARPARVSRPARIATPARPAAVAAVGGRGEPGEPGSALRGGPELGPNTGEGVLRAVSGTQHAGGSVGSGQQPATLGARATTPRAPLPDPGAPTPPRSGAPAPSAYLAPHETTRPDLHPKDGAFTEDGADSAEVRPRSGGVKPGPGESGTSPAVNTAEHQSDRGFQGQEAPAPSVGAPLAATENRASPGVGAMERVNRIQALEEALDSRSPGRIHLELENVDGAGTRLRLALRGGQLGGSLELEDPAAALRMRARIGELHEALARQGLDAQALGVQRVVAAVGRGGDQDARTLAQDPLAGLARLGEARDPGPDSRGDRGGETKNHTHRDPDRNREFFRRDSKKEDGR